MSLLRDESDSPFAVETAKGRGQRVSVPAFNSEAATSVATKTETVGLWERHNQMLCGGGKGREQSSGTAGKLKAALWRQVARYWLQALEESGHGRGPERYR